MKGPNIQRSSVPGRGVAKWKPRHIDAVGVAVCIVAAIPLWFTRVNPLLHSEALADGRNTRLEVLHRNAAKLADSVARHRGVLAEFRKTLSDEEIELESAGGINRRIARLTSLADRSGLAVDEIMPGKASHGQRHDTVPIDLRGSGSYPRCATFFRRLASTCPDTSVASFELSRDPQRSDKPASFRLRLLWYTIADGDGSERK